MYEKYYLIIFRIYWQEYYTFWYTDDKDGFMFDESGLIRSFPTKEQAVTFSKEKGFEFDTDEPLIISTEILKNINIRKIKCNRFLNYWNTFQDAAYSINCPYLGDDRKRYVIQHTYEKLFYGCNIFLEKGVAPYRPKWSRKERRWIAKVMRNGFEIAAKGLGCSDFRCRRLDK